MGSSVVLSVVCNCGKDCGASLWRVPCVGAYSLSSWKVFFCNTNCGNVSSKSCAHFKQEQLQGTR